MIKTVETSPGIYAQGEFIAFLGDLARVKDGDTVHTGKLVECVKKCSKEGKVYE